MKRSCCAVVVAVFVAASFPAFVRAEASTEACESPKVIAPRPSDSAQWPAWVDQRVKELQPTPQERKFDQIGWVHTILEAQKLAREHHRPVFLFTHDGRMNTGRC